MPKNKGYFDINYVIQLQKGDQSAFDVIYKHYKNHIYWMGISYFSDKEKAQDLVQAVFLEIYQTIGKLKDPNKFYPWMNRIAYNRCLQILRYDMKDSLYYTDNMGDDFTDSFIKDEKSDALITYVQKERIKEIIIAEIETLSPKYRAICYLRFFEDLSYVEIKEITNIPLGTITNYIGRLKPKLQKVLQEHGFTSAGCLSLIILPNLIGYFQAFIDRKGSFSMVDAEHILQEVKQSKKVLHKQSKKSWQMAAYGCIGIALTLPIGVSLLPKRNMPMKQMLDGKDAVIQTVTYPKELTNSPFKLQVQVSNKNYDELLLDKKTDLTVYWNGNYKLSLMRKGEEIDSKIISVTNLDRDIPKVTSENFKNGIMTLHLEDKDSEIDFEQIEFYENGVLTNNYKVNKEKSEVYVSKDTSESNLLKVPDTAGNVLGVKIIFYERVL